MSGREEGDPLDEPITQNSEVFVVNRLREIIELEIVGRDYEIDKDVTMFNHRPPLLQVFQTFQVMWQSTLQPTHRAQLAQVLTFFGKNHLDGESVGGESVGKREIPLIFRNPLLLLIELLLSLYPIGNV